MKISSKLMRGLVAKLVKRTIKSKTGYEVDIDLHDFSAEVVDGAAKVHLNLDANLNASEFNKILKAAGL